jgi:antitoxin HicB
MKDINYYLSLKYPIEILETEEGFVASHPDLAGCASFGDTASEAIESLNEVRQLWLRGQVETTGSAPEPRPPEEFSGRFVLRLPKWLHRILDQEARRQSSSLNTFVVSLLSVGLGSARALEREASPRDVGWSYVQDAWETAADNRAKWSIEKYFKETCRRSDYATVFTAMGKRKTLVIRKGHQEVFTDASKVEEKQPN